MDLYGKKDLAINLFNEGIFEIKDIPEEKLENKRHIIQHGAHKSWRHHINHEELNEFIGKLDYPLYFMDFETYGPAIPIYDGTKPYQQMPFQFSVHVVSKQGVKPKHISFIAEGSADPREAFLTNLKKSLGTKGSIVTYNAPFEKGRLKELALFLPKHAKWVDSILPRVVDLLVPFRNFSYYHPSQKGSASIKQVLPAVTGETYADLEISEGESASRLYYEMIHVKNLGDKEKAKLLKDLEEYCSLDTEGMIMILNELQKFVKKK